MAKSFWEDMTQGPLAVREKVTMEGIDWEIIDIAEDYLQLRSKEGGEIYLPSTAIHRVRERGRKVFLNE